MTQHYSVAQIVELHDALEKSGMTLVAGISVCRSKTASG
jgi:hypothetical protein